jgi:hypothetical protein
MAVATSVKPPKVDAARALRTTSMLAERFRRMYNPAAMKIEPEQVIKVLNQAAVKFVLMGAHGIGPWMHEPRGTRDVDVLVQKSHQRKAVRAIRVAFPALIVEDYPAVTRFLDPTDRQLVIDLMKAVEEIHRSVLKDTKPAGALHRFPTLEMALACKFAAMTSPNRSERKKHLDAADLIAIVERHFENIDRDVLFSLGDMVPDRAGTEVLKLVDDIQAGRPIRAR